MTHPIVSHDQWLAARKALLAREKELSHLRDAVAAERRALPWERIEKTYTFDTPSGKRTLADLFEGRSQLVVQHFMFAPEQTAGCPGCSFQADHVDAARQHFEHNGLSFAAVSRAPIKTLEAYRERMGWGFTWVSSGNSDFSYDFHVAFTPAEVEKGEGYYNYAVIDPEIEDLPGVSVFYRAPDGGLFHTYSTYARGGEELLGALMYLDLTPLGRNETSALDWVRRHDEYES